MHAFAYYSKILCKNQGSQAMSTVFFHFYFVFDFCFHNLRASITLIDAHFVTEKCIKNKAAFSLLI